MKSLQESLFDNDLVSKKLPYEKLLSGRISKQDIHTFINGLDYGDFGHVKNKIFRKWCSGFYHKISDFSKPFLPPGVYTWVGEDYFSSEAVQDALNWLKPGKRHTDLSFNDSMYANVFIGNMLWDGVGSNSDASKNITEWVMDCEKDSNGYAIWFLINRKEYDDADQMVIHKMIETLCR